MERKVLRASAGTGKTYRLSLEYAISLFKGEKIKDIVVMTFTKKATAEIKEDIIKFITKLAKFPESDEEFNERKMTIKSIMDIYPGIFSSEEIYLKAREAYNEILLNKDNLKIYTIDGLKNNIFKTTIAPMININSYEIIDDEENKEYLKKCFEKLFENKSDFNSLKNFLEFNTERNVENYISIIKQIIEDRWKILLLDKKNKELYKIDKKFDEIDRAFEIIKDISERNEKPFIGYVNSAYQPYKNIETKAEKEKFILDNWDKILKSNIHNGSKIKGKKYAEEIEELLELKFELSEEISKIIYNENIIPYEREILSFLERIYEIYDEIKQREKRLTQTDITNYTLKYINNEKLNLTDENGITEYMKDILESDITTVFIDEFQDTSVVQWKIFKNMIKSARRVICVGDEKQSIYGWRGGEKGLFTSLSKIISADEETMDTSYRSRKRVVDFTNLIFEKYSLYAKMEDIKWEFERVKTIDELDRGYVYIYNGTEDKKVEKIESYQKIIDILKEKFNGNYRDTCILARNNSTLQEMEIYLLENHIPYFIETNSSIFEHRTTLPIVKLMKYFIYNNIFYLVEFLRDDILAISDNAMKELLVFKNSFNTLENFCFSKIENNIILEKIKKLKIKYEENKSNDIDILIDIIKEFNVLNIYKTESDVLNIYNFIDVSKRFLNLKEFLNEIIENSDLKEYQQSSIEVQNAVTLMTIHKSKGLGFDTVFYIHNENKSRAKKGALFNTLMSNDFDKIEDYLILDAKCEKSLKYLDNQFDYESYNKKREEEEEINNIYVALTRAKKNIFVIVKHLKKESLMKKILNEDFLSDEMLIYEDGVLEIDKIENIEMIEDLSTPINFQLDFKKYNYREGELEKNELKLSEEEFKYSEDREEKRYIGNIVHFFLENIIYLTEKEREISEVKTISKYGASFGKENILKILSSEGLRVFLKENIDIFSDEWDFIYPEYEIYSELNNELYRLDRLMIKLPKYLKNGLLEKGKILIVDYKTGGFEESQLEKYEQAILERLPEREKFEIEKRYLQIHI